MQRRAELHEEAFGNFYRRKEPSIYEGLYAREDTFIHEELVH